MTYLVVTIVMLAVSVALAACSPQAALVAALVPEGTATVLLGNLEKVSDENRRRVSELEKAGRWDELARFAEKNVTTDPANADWWMVLGYARSQLAQYAAAAEAFSSAARLEPDNADAWNLLAQAYRAKGEPHRAVNALNNLITAGRTTAVTFFLLGESYSDLRRYEDAASAYREAVRLEPRFPAAWFALASIYSQLGRRDDAREARDALELLDPNLAARLGEGGGVKPR